MGTGWDEAAPAVTNAHGVGVYEIRDLRMGARIRLAKEHKTPATSSAGGEHKQGSAVCWHQASAPTTRPDETTALTSDDVGRIWIDSTNHVMKELAAVGTPNTWTPIAEIALATYSVGSEPTRGLYMKGNALYFKGADATEKFIAGLLDEDDMASNSATHAPSQQSVKAYVDTQDGTVLATAEGYTDDEITSVMVDEDDMASDSDELLPTQQSVKAYVDALMSRYDSGWFAVTQSTVYTKVHGLGAIPSIVQLWYSNTEDGSGDVVPIGNGMNGAVNGIIDVNATNIVMRTANAMATYYDTGGSAQNPFQGYWRVQAFLFR